jgi:hypothetical protein
MDGWLRPSKLREYRVDRRFDDVNEAERQHILFSSKSETGIK